MKKQDEGLLRAFKGFKRLVKRLDYYPHHILKHLNLLLGLVLAFLGLFWCARSMRQIFGFILSVLSAIGLVFFLVTLVVGLFNAGDGCHMLLASRTGHS